MADNETKTCPKDCMLCHPNQRLYCAANWSRLIIERMDEIQERFNVLEEKIEKLDHADEGVFNPMAEEDESDDQSV